MSTRGHFKFAARQLIWGRKTMGNNKASRKPSARRAAAFLAALGVLVMSSGVALMVAATPANAAPDPKVVVCKYVSTPGGTLDHIVIVSENTLQNTGYVAPPPASWTDAHGQSTQGSIAIRYANEGEQANDVATSECPQGEEEPTDTAAVVTFTDPTCDNNNEASYDASGEGIDFEVTSGSAAPGADIVVTATAQDGFNLTNGPEFSHTFGAALDLEGEPCVSVSPPVVDPPVVDPPVVDTPDVNPPTVTPTVVHAGLAGTSTPDLRGQQGLALMFAGMVMLLGAGGLGLRSRSSRI
jgi:hypothetical protein